MPIKHHTFGAARRGSMAAAAVAAGALVLLAAGPAWAHVEADPAEVKAGATEVVTFTTEHGCAGGDTNKFEVVMPDGVTDPEPQAKDGWTGAVSGQTVDFTGGVAPTKKPASFAIKMTFPSAAGQLWFKAVQFCTDGDALRWIVEPKAGEDPEEMENPTPGVKVTASGSSETTATTGSSGSTATSATTAAKSDKTGNTGTIVLVVVLAVIAAGGAGLVLTRRRGTAS